MKKEYVKPVIESEEFVANEYVAACWVVTCVGSKSHGQEVIFTEPNWDIGDGDAFFKIFGKKYYAGEICGQIGESSITGLVEGYLHQVDVKDGANGGASEARPEHPNASA